MTGSGEAGSGEAGCAGPRGRCRGRRRRASRRGADGRPRLDNTDVDGYHPSVGDAGIDSSAGGERLHPYRGGDGRDKEPVGQVAGPETTCPTSDGTVPYSLANARLERVDFGRAASRGGYSRGLPGPGGAA